MIRILINWNYERFDLTEYLLDFASEMELVFIYKQFRQDPPDWMRRKNVSIIYWSDYASPYDMLRKVNPSTLVFADLESFNQIALNIAGRNKNIKTFVLQHGLRGAFEVDEALSINGQNENRIRFSPTSTWSILFLLRALRLKNVMHFPKLLKFIFQRKKKDLTTSLYNNILDLRKADFYIEFSEENCSYHRKRDGIEQDRFIITGNPFLDTYFEYLNVNHKSGDYCLLIDCPFLEAHFYNDPGIDAVMKKEYLKKLDKWSSTNGFTLKVKLHPVSFKSTDLFLSDTIEYFREADLKELIAGSAVVFFVHFSSIAPAVLYYKPSIYFHFSLEEHGNIFRRLGTPELPLFTFDETKTDLQEKAVRISRTAMIPFLHTTDGKAAERVKNALINYS